MVNGITVNFGEGNTKKRIKNVLNYKKPAFWIVAAAAAVAVVIGAGLLTNSKTGVVKQIKEVPEMQLTYTVAGEINTISITPRDLYWHYADEEDEK